MSRDLGNLCSCDDVRLPGRGCSFQPTTLTFSPPLTSARLRPDYTTPHQQHNTQPTCDITPDCTLMLTNDAALLYAGSEVDAEDSFLLMKPRCSYAGSDA